MKLAETLLEGYSKEHTMAICALIRENNALFDELWSLLKNGEPPLPQRAAWVLSHIGEMEPQLLNPYFGDILPLFQKDTHGSVHRGLARSLAFMKVPEAYEGELYDLALAWIASPTKPIAVRVHLMEVAANIALPYVELRQELVAVIEAQMSWGSAGYKSRGKRIIKKLKSP